MYASMKSLQAKMGATTITDLTVTAVPPDAPLTPSFSAASVSAVTNRAISASAPTYTSPTTDITGTAWATAFPADYTDITTALDAANTNIDTFITKTNLLYDQTTIFDGSNYDYKQVSDKLDKAQRLIQNAASGGTGWDDATDTDNISKSVAGWLTDEDPEMAQATLATVQAEIGLAQAEIAQISALKAQAGGYLQAASSFVAEAQSRLGVTGARVSEYQIRVQDALNEFNQENIAYQQDIQEALGEMQVAAAKAQKDADFTQQTQIQEYTNKLQKFQMEYAGYTAEVNEQVQAYTQNLQADGMGYQWLQGQYAALKAEYDAAFMIAAPKQQPQQQVRR